MAVDHLRHGSVLVRRSGTVAAGAVAVDTTDTRVAHTALGTARNILRVHVVAADAAYRSVAVAVGMDCLARMP
jgi:hypothetical protein